MWLITAGGAPSFVIVFFGIVALASAARFAWRPDPSGVPYILGLSGAVLFASVAGVMAALASVAVHVTGNDEWAQSPDMPLIVLAGFGESMAPGILGFTILSVVALIASVGLRRMPAG